VAATARKAKVSFWGRLLKYFRDARSELRKVAWPNRKELITYTVIVLVTVAIVALFLGVFDVVFARLIGFLSRLGG
jgi:preprotein translocase subunit SecE